MGRLPVLLSADSKQTLGVVSKFTRGVLWKHALNNHLCANRSEFCLLKANMGAEILGDQMSVQFSKDLLAVGESNVLSDEAHFNKYAQL